MVEKADIIARCWTLHARPVGKGQRKTGVAEHAWPIGDEDVQADPRGSFRACWAWFLAPLTPRNLTCSPSTASAMLRPPSRWTPTASLSATTRSPVCRSMASRRRQPREDFAAAPPRLDGDGGPRPTSKVPPCFDDRIVWISSNGRNEDGKVRPERFQLFASHRLDADNSTGRRTSRPPSADCQKPSGRRTGETTSRCAKPSATSRRPTGPRAEEARVQRRGPDRQRGRAALLGRVAQSASSTARRSCSGSTMPQRSWTARPTHGRARPARHARSRRTGASATSPGRPRIMPI